MHQYADSREQKVSPAEAYLGVPGFLGVLGLLLCHRCAGMVKASTLIDKVLDGMVVNCLRSELYL